jgi:hypothetical protein
LPVSAGPLNSCFQLRPDPLLNAFHLPKFVLPGID